MTKFLSNINDNYPFFTVNHINGFKKVLMDSFNPDSKITQVAFGVLYSGENIEAHLHETMEEVFFFLKGEGVFKLDDQSFNIKIHDFFYVPSSISHSIVAFEDLEFIYLGIAI
jgi:mannose-6-phosphate isomerase-like protein (cupin superfamily)